MKKALIILAILILVFVVFYYLGQRSVPSEKSDIENQSIQNQSQLDDNKPWPVECDECDKG